MFSVGRIPTVKPCSSAVWAVTGPMHATLVLALAGASLLRRPSCRQSCDRRRTVKVMTSMRPARAAFETAQVGRRRNRLIDRNHIDRRALQPQLIRQDLACDLRPRNQHLFSIEVLIAHCCQQAFGLKLGRDDVSGQSMTSELLGCPRSDGGDPEMSQRLTSWRARPSRSINGATPLTLVKITQAYSAASRWPCREPPNWRAARY